MTQVTYSLRTRQQLSISPRLQQAVRLLQASTLELEQELRQAVATNPFLDEDEGDAPVATGTLEADAGGDVEMEAGGDEDISLPVAADSTATLVSELDGVREHTYDAPLSRSAGFDEAGDEEDWASVKPGLRDHLRAQIWSADSSPRERIALEMLIETIDDDGYLRGNVAEAAAMLDLDPPLQENEIEQALAKLHRFDPVGVGARSIEECLVLQLEAIEEDSEERQAAVAIARNHLPLLARREYALLRQRVGCDDQILFKAIALIRRLDPHPGDRYSPVHAGYITPDVIVTLVRGQPITTINPAVLPRAHLNQAYISMLRQAREEPNPGLTQQLREARWLMRNIEQRLATIHRVAEAIVERQRSFFICGDVALKPLILRELADHLGLHESTISRATTNKYMATPRGTFEFKHFFSRQLETGTGGRCSAAAVRALMKEILEEEDKRDPLSDVSLAKMLASQGIRVARRTVTKYRTMMKVPPAELRRQG